MKYLLIIGVVFNVIAWVGIVGMVIYLITEFV